MQGGSQSPYEENLASYYQAREIALSIQRSRSYRGPDECEIDLGMLNEEDYHRYRIGKHRNNASCMLELVDT